MNYNFIYKEVKHWGKFFRVFCFVTHFFGVVICYYFAALDYLAKFSISPKTEIVFFFAFFSNAPEYVDPFGHLIFYEGFFTYIRG